MRFLLCSCLVCFRCVAHCRDIIQTARPQVESANIGKAAPKPQFLDEEAEQGDGRLKEEGEAQSGESDEVNIIKIWIRF